MTDEDFIERFRTLENRVKELESEVCRTQPEWIAYLSKMGTLPKELPVD